MRLQPGLRRRPRSGSLQRFPRLLPDFKRWLHGEEGAREEIKEKEREGKKRKGRARDARKGEWS